MLPTRQIYTVSQLNSEVRTLLESTFPPVWIEGEISNLSQPGSGHFYFSLKDHSAQLRCAMFNGRNRHLNFNLKNGMQVLVRAKISLYEQRGDYQLIVDTIEEAGDGALKRAFELLKNKLAQEDLFSERHKKPLPSLPKYIGVITSPTGAAIRDILSVLKRRAPHVSIIIYPTLVQGKEAPMNIVRALQTANERNECDVLILTRGGGSLEDLWAFNEEIVARAIFASQIPIVSGIGHEIDFTIADFVADRRAPTPSAAAEMMTSNIQDAYPLLAKLFQRLQQQAVNLLREKQQQLLGLTKRLRHPGQRLQEYTQRLDMSEQRLLHGIRSFLLQKNQQFNHLSRALNAISPLATLSRGYAIVMRTDDKTIVTNAKAINPGDQITARLGHGELWCTVDSTSNVSHKQ